MEIRKLAFSFCVILSLVTTWSSTYRRASKCPRPTGFNGRPIKYRRNGNRAVFKCRRNSQLYGTKRLDCQSDGTWSAKIPVCIKTGCIPVDLSHSEYLDMVERFSGALLTFTCEAGYQLLGATEVYCDGRTWNEPLPSCAATADLTECDFEEGLCGWTQDDTDQADWTRNAGATPTGNTGPMNDHTFMNKNTTGHYLFFESSNPTVANDQARLNSPEYMADMSPMCFDFWYHMLGPDDDGHVGSIEVFVVGRSQYIDEIQPEFMIKGNQGNLWHRGEIVINEMSEPYRIVIVGTRKLGFVSDVAIDDLRLYNCTEDTTIVPTTIALTSRTRRTFTTPSSTPTTVLTQNASTSALPSSPVTSNTTTVVVTSSAQDTTHSASNAPNTRQVSSSSKAPTTTSSVSITTAQPPTTTISRKTSTRSITSTTQPVSSKPTTPASTDITGVVTTRLSPSTTKVTTAKVTDRTPPKTTRLKTTTIPSTITTSNPTSSPTTPPTRPITSSSPPPTSTPMTPPTSRPTTRTSPTKPTTKRTKTTKMQPPSTDSTSTTSTKLTTLKPTEITKPPTFPVSSTKLTTSTTQTPTKSTTLQITQKKTMQSMRPVTTVSKSKSSTVRGGNTTKSNASSTLASPVTVASTHPADETLKPLMIGLGVGIVAGLIVIGVIAYVCIKRRKFYTSRYEDELKPITTAGSTHSINNVQYYHDEEEEYEN